MIRVGDEISLVSEVPKAVLDKLVLAGMSRAQRYGLLSESSRTRFVVLMFEIAPNFDAYPPAGDILNNPAIDIESRMDELARRLSSRDWKIMNRSYDHNAWM